MSLIIGAFMSNTRPIPEIAWTALKRGGFNGALLMAQNHGPADARRAFGVLGEGARVIVRLPDSSTADRVLGAAEYAAECRAHIEAFYAAGVREFQIDNEPSWQPAWARYAESVSQPVQWAYQAFYQDVLDRLHFVGPGYRLGMCQLSSGGCDADDTPIERDVLPEWQEAMAGCAALVDWIAAPCYWQSFEAIGSGLFGANYRRFHRWQPDKEIVITEFGPAYAAAGYDLGTIHWLMKRDYAGFVAQVKREATANNVSMAVLFIIRPSNDWIGYSPPFAALDVLRKAINEPSI